MARVDLYVQNTLWTVGEDWFVHAFFSTIAYRLEPDGWGSHFPALMNELYTGRLPRKSVPKALQELHAIRAELAQRPPDERVFAYEDQRRPTPWPVPPGAQSVADCFVTASGDNLLDVIEEALRDALKTDADVEIRPFSREGTYDHFVTG